MTWGRSSNGLSLVPTLPANMTYTRVAAGSLHSLAMRSDGNVVAWGSNAYGQTTVPALPTGVTYTDISGGSRHSAAVRSDGAIVVFGDNTYGQRSVPTLQSGQVFHEVAAGAYFTVGRLNTGAVLVWGLTNGGVGSVPALNGGLTYVQIAAGGEFVLARRSDGSVIGWGNGANGQTTAPALSGGLSYVDIAAGGWHGMAVRSDGAAVGWGYNSWGQAQNIPALPASSLCGCPGSVLSNGDFSQGLVAGSMPTARAANWSDRTQTPQVLTSQGCNSPGCMLMWGNQLVGESIQQNLPGAGIVAGKTYRLSLWYRWHTSTGLPPYVRFRVSATTTANGSYPSTQVGYDVIGVTPNTSSTAWVPFSIEWTAPNNASWITVNPENDFALNNGAYVSWGQVDDLCLREVALATAFGNGCDQLAPLLTAAAPPVLGTTIDLVTTNLLTMALGVQILSFTKIFPGISLTPQGMPGCARYVDADSTNVFLPVGNIGRWSFAIPADPAFVGVEVFAQSLVMVPGINALGATVSNGLTLKLGY